MIQKEDDNAMTRQNVYKSRKLSTDDVGKLLSYKSEDIDLKTLKVLFAYSRDSKPLYDPSDTFRLPKSVLYNSEEENTTVGRYIFNLVLLDDKLGNLIGYQNKVFGDDGLGDLNSELSNLLILDKINTKDMSKYIDKLQWLGFSISSFINASMTTDLVQAPDKVRLKREELLEKYSDKLDEGEKELL